MLKFIDIQQTKNHSTHKSGLIIRDNGLEVLGVIPHNTIITLDKANLLLLLEWTARQLFEKAED